MILTYVRIFSDEIYVSSRGANRSYSTMLVEVDSLSVTYEALSKLGGSDSRGFSIVSLYSYGDFREGYGRSAS